MKSPETRKSDHVDVYRGTRVPDPYRWLEDDTSTETAAWVNAQNGVTQPYLKQIPFRAELQARVLQLNDYENTRRHRAKGRGSSLRGTPGSRIRAFSSCSTDSKVRRKCCSIPIRGRSTAPSG